MELLRPRRGLSFSCFHPKRLGIKCFLMQTDPNQVPQGLEFLRCFGDVLEQTAFDDNRWSLWHTKTSGGISQPQDWTASLPKGTSILHVGRNAILKQANSNVRAKLVLVLAFLIMAHMVWHSWCECNAQVNSLGLFKFEGSSRYYGDTDVCPLVILHVFI